MDQQTGKPRIAVIGDAITDVYHPVRPAKIAQEFCGIAYEQSEQVAAKSQAGGASLVREMLESLGCKSELFPKDQQPSTKHRWVCQHDSRPTQIVFRLDRDRHVILTEEDRGNVIRDICNFRPDLVIVSDYDKGAVWSGIVKDIRRSYDGPIFVDPYSRTWNSYEGATAIFPSRKSGESYINDLSAWSGMFECAVFKLDHEGSIIQYANSNRIYGFCSQAKFVRDVTGAGDQFIATAALAFVRSHAAENLQERMEDSVAVASVAAAMQVERDGVRPVTLSELLDRVETLEQKDLISSTT